MPNTLVHFAAQGAASRSLWQRLDARWIYLGCLLPDVPWIVRRVVASLVAVDPIDLRVYAMAQASLAVTLLLCAAFAAVTARPRLALAVLAFNALLHLLLDACEVKWGNGVHLFAPFSWRMTSFDLVAGEGAVLLALSLAGALLVAWEIVRPRTEVLALDLRPRRLAVAAAFLSVYALAPLALLRSVEASDSYSVSTLRQEERRVGATLGLDRASFRRAADGGVVELWTGEIVRTVGVVPEHDARVSLTGRFLQRDVLHVERFVEHRQNRDWPTYLALSMLGVLWARSFFGRAPRVAAERRTIGKT